MTQAPTTATMRVHGYDNVNRLGSVNEMVTAGESGGGAWSFTHGYDQFGNMWVSSTTGLAAHSATPRASDQFGATTNRLTKAFDGSTLSNPYDEAGNLINHPYVGAMQYDAESRQKQFTSGSTTATYHYDGDGRRVKRVLGGQTTVYVYDAFGMLAAEYSTATPTETGGRRYRTTDHLGSTRLVTDDAGAVKTRHDYLPFGEELPASSSAGNRNLVFGFGVSPSERHKFTGKERDVESGLDYFGARYFAASMGRFTSVDPNNAGVRLGNPQSWNGYGYSINNPLRYVDPDGKDFRDAVEGFANAFGSNAVGGIGRVEVGSRPSESADFRLGQAVGDAVSVVAGTIEVLGGFGTGGAGVAACGTGVGCAATPAAVATSSLLVVQGGTLAANGLGNLVAAAQDNNPTSSGAPQEGLIGSNPREAKGRTNTDLPGGQKAATDLFTGRTKGQKVTTDPKTGHQVAADGTRLRLSPDGTARVDVPKSTTRPKHETIHFNDPDKLNQP